MSEFRIAAAQVPSVAGNIAGTVATHAAAVEAAAAHGVSVLVFPELSLTGYEPGLAATLAIKEVDPRLSPLHVLARRHHIDIVAGAPLDTGSGKPALGAIVFTAGGAILTYRKMHLGESERPFFAPGDVPLAFTARGHTVGIAICADASQPSHAQSYATRGADVYAAGVFLNAEWYATDAPRLARCAAQHGLLTVMANHAASTGTRTSPSAGAPYGSPAARSWHRRPASRPPWSWRGAVTPAGEARLSGSEVRR